MRPGHGNERLILRPGTVADWRSYYGVLPRYSAKTLVADLDGKVIGITGIEYRKKLLYAFGDMGPEMRPYRKALVRAGHWLIEQMNKAGAPVVAVANPSEPTASGMFIHMGFVHMGATADGEVYQWRKPQSR